MSIKVKDFEVRKAVNEDERRQVRRLRYDAFIEEDGGIPTPEMQALHEEFDRFDEHAEYMVVLHKDKIVGCYRMIDRAAAEKMDGFYTETEYDISKIKSVKGNIAEMSRACVKKEYRDTFAMQMLWLGLGDYIKQEGITVLFGLGSFPGTNPTVHAREISYLYHYRLADAKLCPTVRLDLLPPGVDKDSASMNLMSAEDIGTEEDAFKNMPTLIKGYLRIGATFGEGVYVDSPYNLSDVFLLVETAKITPAYQKRFGGAPDAFADLKVEF